MKYVGPAYVLVAAFAVYMLTIPNISKEGWFIAATWSGGSLICLVIFSRIARDGFIRVIRGFMMSPSKKPFWKRFGFIMTWTGGLPNMEKTGDVGYGNRRLAGLLIILGCVNCLAGRVMADTITNGIMRVCMNCSNGIFTVSTDTSHPQGIQNVLYGGGSCSPGTSFITLKDDVSLSMWDNGGGRNNIEGYTARSMVLTGCGAIGGGVNGLRSVFSCGAFTVTQDVVIEGTDISNTSVRQTVTIHNTSGSTRQYGVRFMWDWEVANEDYPIFRTRNPDGPWESNPSVTTEYLNPVFAQYEIVDALPPAFNVYGTVGGSSLPIPPTPPDWLRYARYQEAANYAWNFTSANGDTVVTYYWGYPVSLQLAAGESKSFTQYMTTNIEAIASQAVIKQQVPDNPGVGEAITYKIIVKNTGSAAVLNMAVTDTVSPVIVNATTSQPAGWSAPVIDSIVGEGTRFIWSNAGLNMLPGTVYTFTIVGKIGMVCAPTSITNTAFVNASSASSNIKNISNGLGFIVLPSKSDIAVATTNSSANPAAGSVLTCRITVQNTGAATISALVVTDTLSPVIVNPVASQPVGWSAPTIDSVTGGTRFTWSKAGFSMLPGVV